MSEEKEKFLSRWARIKEQSKEAPPPAPTQSAVPARAESAPLPELPPVEELTFDSNFRDFLHPRVDEDMKRAALKKLFSDPHFNVMDGLDTYIDDYSKGETLPAEMLAQLKSAQKILKWARNEPEEEEAEKPALPVQASVPAPEPQVVLADAAESTALPAADLQSSAPVVPSPADDITVKSTKQQ